MWATLKQAPVEPFNAKCDSLSTIIIMNSVRFAYLKRSLQVQSAGWTGSMNDIYVLHFLHGDSEVNRDHTAHGWNQLSGYANLTDRRSKRRLSFSRPQRLQTDASSRGTCISPEKIEHTISCFWINFLSTGTHWFQGHIKGFRMNFQRSHDVCMWQTTRLKRFWCHFQKKSAGVPYPFAHVELLSWHPLQIQTVLWSKLSLQL